jgi:hypothetical protein
MSIARGSGVAAGTNSSRNTYISTRAYNNDFFRMLQVILITLH